ncbi:hypothetical protein MBLNU459_g8184t1 [Dothideomycetes sp. NU459]
MRFLARFAAAAILAGHVLAAPLIATPGDASDLIITSKDTVNATAIAGTSEEGPHVHILTASTSSSTAGQLDISMVNNLASNNVNAYVTGLDSNGLLVMLLPNGSWFYPTATNSGVPQAVTQNVAIPLGGEGSTTTITLPGYISAGRVWFADGTLQFYTVRGGTGAVSLVEPSAVNPSDPSANVNWGFVELTNTENDGIYANISYVDFLGLPLGMQLTGADGGVQTAEGVDADAIDGICADLAAQEKKDGYPWGELCMTDKSGNNLRVLAPPDYISIKPTAFQDYFTSYVNQVWTHYKTTPLTIHTQAAAGNVNCTVNGSYLNCTGDNRGYAKPSAADIFGCSSGPFAFQAGDNAVHYAVVPRLCAAFHRATLLLKGGNVTPGLSSSSYYAAEPANWYSAFVHDYEIDGKGYAFSYDDVTPDDATNESGLVSTLNPKLLKVTVGGPSC